VLRLAFLLALSCQNAVQPPGDAADPKGTGPSVLGHARAVASPDGRLLAVGCEDGSVRVVDLDARQQRWCLQGHGSPVAYIAFDERGGRLAAAAGDEVISWDVVHGVRQARLPLDPADTSYMLSGARVPSTLAYQPGGEHLLTRIRSQATVWDLSSGRRVLELESGGAPPGHVAWGPHGELAVGGLDRRISLFDPDLEPIGALEAPGPVRFLAFDPYGEQLVSAGDDLSATLWDLRRRRVLKTLPHDDVMDPIMVGDYVGHASFSADGRTLLTATSAPWVVCRWDVLSGRRTWVHDYGGGNPSPVEAFFTGTEDYVVVTGGISQLLSASTGLAVEDTPGTRLGTVPGTDLVFRPRGDGVEVSRCLPRSPDGAAADAQVLQPLFTYAPCESGAWRLDHHDR
jgi:WD40 repeat protein